MLQEFHSPLACHLGFTKGPIGGMMNGFGRLLVMNSTYLHQLFSLRIQLLASNWRYTQYLLYELHHLNSSEVSGHASSVITRQKLPFVCVFFWNNLDMLTSHHRLRHTNSNNQQPQSIHLRGDHWWVKCRNACYTGASSDHRWKLRKPTCSDSLLQILLQLLVLRRR